MFYTSIRLIRRSWGDLEDGGRPFFPMEKQAILSLEMFRNQKQRDTSAFTTQEEYAKTLTDYSSSSYVHDHPMQKEEYATRQTNRFRLNLKPRLHYCCGYHQPYLLHHAGD